MTYSAKTDPDKLRERRIRRKAQRLDYFIQKSRVVYPNLDNYGGYRIIDASNCSLVAGERYEMSLDDLEEFFSE